MLEREGVNEAERAPPGASHRSPRRPSEAKAAPASIETERWAVRRSGAARRAERGPGDEGAGVTEPDRAAPPNATGHPPLGRRRPSARSGGGRDARSEERATSLERQKHRHTPREYSVVRPELCDRPRFSCPRPLPGGSPRMSTTPATGGSGASSVPSPDPLRWKALLVIGIAQLMVVLDASIVNLALPSRQGRPRHQRRRPAVGGHGVHPHLRRPAAARRPHRRLRGPQARLHHRSARVRRRLGARRHRADGGAAVRGPRAAGRVRRAAGAGGAVADHGDLPRAQGARPRVRRLRRDRRRWRRDRTAARRRPHRVPLVALVPAGQHPDRDHRGGAGCAVRAGEPGRGRRELRRRRCRHRHARTRRAGVRLHQGRAEQLHGVGELDRAEHPRVVRPRGDHARDVLRGGDPGVEPARADARAASTATAGRPTWSR